MSLSPGARTARARLAAATRWSKTVDRAGATAPARAAAMARFERDVDPDGKLEPALRAKLAASAKRAYFARLAFAGAR